MYFKREFDKKHGNCGVLARFVLLLSGMAILSYLIQHGCKIVEVNNSDNFLNYKNLPLLTEPSDKIIIRAMEEGRTNYVPHVINGNNYKIVVMGNKQYIPDVTAQQ